MIPFLRPSHLDLLCTCPRKYQHVVLQGLVDGDESVSETFGTAWHLILHLIRLGAEPMDAWTQATKDYKNPLKGAKTSERLKLGIQHYLSRYDGTLKPVSPKASEQESLVQVPGILVPVKTHMDGIVWWDSGEGKGEEKWIVDHKTTGRLVGDWVQKYSVSNQFKCYYEVGRLEEPAIVGVLADIFHVTPGVTTARGRVGKSPAQQDGCHFYRLPVRYTDFVIQEWKKTVNAKLHELESYIANDFFPMHAPTACGAYGSNCPFLNICSQQHPDLRETMRTTYLPNENGPELV